MAQNVLATVIPEQFKIAVVRGQPLIQNLAHSNDARLDTKSPRGLFPPVSAVAFHMDSFHKHPTLST